MPQAKLLQDHVCSLFGRSCHSHNGLLGYIPEQRLKFRIFNSIVSDVIVDDIINDIIALISSTPLTNAETRLDQTQHNNDTELSKGNSNRYYEQC